MLDMLNYSGYNILNKTIFESSFGDGAFLTAIVQRILQYASQYNLSSYDIQRILDNVYGVEIDKKYYEITIHKLNQLISQYHIEYDWHNLICGNTLHYKPTIKFDLIVSNPPYIRCHDYDLETRKEIEANYQFGTGNTDLYVIFFEHCFRMATPTSKLCFITPNSYFKNTSQKTLRKYLSDNNLIHSIVDYGNVQVFGNVATYTAVTLFDFEKNSEITEYTFMKSETEEEYKTTINLRDFGDKPWTFMSNSDYAFLREIQSREMKLSDLCDIQYGLATNADKIYIVQSEHFADFEPEMLRPIIKASTLNVDNKIIFPYYWHSERNRYEVIPEDELKQQYPKTYEYLLMYKDVLLRRDMEKNTIWYQYARSQGIQNSRNKKFVLKHILTEQGVVCEIQEVDEMILVYSGMFLIVKDEDNYNLVKKILLSEEFHRYLFLIGKNMAGGYRNVNTKAVKEYGIIF